MDQLLAGASTDGVTYAMATALLGYTDAALLDEVVDAFASGDGAAVYGIVDRVIEGGHDPRRFVTDLLERLRDLVIIAAVPDAVEKGLIDAPRDVVERMQAQASVFGAAELSRAADLVNTGLTEMRGATSPRLQLELICARVLLPAAYEDERSLQARLERLERGVSLGGGPANAATAPGGGPGYGDAPGGPAQAGGVAGPGGGPAYGGGPAGPSGPAAARAALGRTATGPAAPAPAPEAQQQPAAPAAPASPPPAPVPPVPPAPPVPDSGDAAPDPSSAPCPGAWPTSAAPGAPAASPAPAPRPGAWPTTAGPSQPNPPHQQTHQQAHQPPSGPPAGASAPPPAPAATPAPSGPIGDPSRVRELWPQILEAVKHRRLTWILLLNNARVVGFDGETLQLGFDNLGARNSFANGDSEDVLKQAIGAVTGARWKIETLVDPGGGGSDGGGRGGPGGGGGRGGPPGRRHPAARAARHRAKARGKAKDRARARQVKAPADRPPVSSRTARAARPPHTARPRPPPLRPPLAGRARAAPPCPAPAAARAPARGWARVRETRVRTPAAPPSPNPRPSRTTSPRRTTRNWWIRHRLSAATTCSSRGSARRSSRRSATTERGCAPASAGVRAQARAEARAPARVHVRARLRRGYGGACDQGRGARRADPPYGVGRWAVRARRLALSRKTRGNPVKPVEPQYSQGP